jgi:hypothetical protein
LPVAGGAYLRVLPELYTRIGLQRVAASGERLMVYLHPWEIDPGQPRLAAPLKSRLRQYIGLSGMESRLERLLNTYRFGSIEEAFQIGKDAVVKAN